MPGRRIFISYRRGDTTIYAGRIHDSLCMRLGDEEVFMDLDAIEPGADFVEHIEREVGSCEVLISLIGRDWIDARDADGARRLDDPADWVRLELEAGLNRDIRVIPVLVQGATMPRADELPGDLAKLARRNALEIGDTRWRYDFDRLMEVIEKVLEGNSVPKAIELSGVRNFVPPPTGAAGKAHDPDTRAPDAEPEQAGEVPLVLVQEKPFPGKEHTVEDGLTLGRTDADVLLPDPQVSRRHAVLRLEDGGAVIEDLGSTNGTFVNSEQLNGPRRLEVGDVVRLGAVAFRLKPAPEGTKQAPRPQGSAGCA
jgi:FHA domain/TIR domain